MFFQHAAVPAMLHLFQPDQSAIGQTRTACWLLGSRMPEEVTCEAVMGTSVPASAEMG